VDPLNAQTTDTVLEKTDSVRRGNYMAALSLAERIMSESSALPTNFTVSVTHFAPNEPELCFYFHHDLAGLRKFRDEQSLSESKEDRDHGRVFVGAKGVSVDGVRIAAWTLLDAEEAPAVSA